MQNFPQKQKVIAKRCACGMWLKHVLQLIVFVLKKVISLSSGIVKGVPSIESGMSEATFRKSIEEGIWTHGQDKRILKSIVHEYTDWSNRDNLNITRQNFLNVGSDAGFKAPAVRSAKAFAKKGLRTYLYQFEHASKYLNGAEVPLWKGVYHRADIHYVLGVPISNDPGSNDTEVMFSRKIIQLWTNFAKTGYVIWEIRFLNIICQILSSSSL